MMILKGNVDIKEDFKSTILYGNYIGVNGK